MPPAPLPCRSPCHDFPYSPADPDGILQPSDVTPRFRQVALNRPALHVIARGRDTAQPNNREFRQFAWRRARALRLDLAAGEARTPLTLGAIGSGTISAGPFDAALRASSTTVWT